MDIFAGLFNGFAIALSGTNILFCFLGALIGTAIGVLPGIGPSLTISLLLPVTFGLEPISAFVMFGGSGWITCAVAEVPLATAVIRTIPVPSDMYCQYTAGSIDTCMVPSVCCGAFTPVPLVPPAKQKLWAPRA